MEAKAMELDTTPPAQVACTQDQTLQLDAARRGFGRMEAHMAEIGGVFDELIAVINLLSEHVGNLRRQRAEGLIGAPDADLVAQASQVESIFGMVSNQVRRMETVRGSMVDMARVGLGFRASGGGGEAVDALALGLKRIRIGLNP